MGTAGKTITLYELCAEDPNRRFSPYCWRTKMACLHKGLKVEGIPMRFNEKDKIKFANSDKVPVLVDGDHVVHESFEIAKYLEKAYPDAPSLFGGAAGEAGCFFVNAYADAIMLHYFPLIMLDVHKRLDTDSAKYFREDREKKMGCTLEELEEGREKKIEVFRKSLDPIRTVLKKQPFLGGESPTYSDFAVVSDFITPRATTGFAILEKEDPINAYLKRVLQLFDNDLLGECVFQY